MGQASRTLPFFGVKNKSTTDQLKEHQAAELDGQPIDKAFGQVPSATPRPLGSVTVVHLHEKDLSLSGDAHL